MPSWRIAPDFVPNIWMELSVGLSPLSSKLVSMLRTAPLSKRTIATARSSTLQMSPPELEACQIPKHILQPIVENSIVHGFLNDCFESLHGETPYIRITISPAGSDSLCICVEDNGIGIDMRAYEKIVEESEHFDMANEYNRGKHIGLANIRWRLAYLLKEKQELKISPCSPHGTRVVIFLPRIS